MKARLLKQLRKNFSSDFIIKEDEKREYGCLYVVSSPYSITYHAASLESAKEWIRERVNERIKIYIEEKRPKSKRYDANGNEIMIPKKSKRNFINKIKAILHI